MCFWWVRKFSVSPIKTQLLGSNNLYYDVTGGGSPSFEVRTDPLTEGVAVTDVGLSWDDEYFSKYFNDIDYLYKVVKSEEDKKSFDVKFANTIDGYSETELFDWATLRIDAESEVDGKSLDTCKNFITLYWTTKISSVNIMQVGEEFVVTELGTPEYFDTYGYIFYSMFGGLEGNEIDTSMYNVEIDQVIARSSDGGDDFIVKTFNDVVLPSSAPVSSGRPYVVFSTDNMDPSREYSVTFSFKVYLNSDVERLNIVKTMDMEVDVVGIPVDADSSTGRQTEVHLRSSFRPSELNTWTDVYIKDITDGALVDYTNNWLYQYKSFIDYVDNDIEGCLDFDMSGEEALIKAIYTESNHSLLIGKRINITIPVNYKGRTVQFITETKFQFPDPSYTVEIDTGAELRTCDIFESASDKDINDSKNITDLKITECVLFGHDEYGSLTEIDDSKYSVTINKDNSAKIVITDPELTYAVELRCFSNYNIFGRNLDDYTWYRI